VCLWRTAANDWKLRYVSARRNRRRRRQRRRRSCLLSVRPRRLGGQRNEIYDLQRAVPGLSAARRQCSLLRRMPRHKFFMLIVEYALVVCSSTYIYICIAFRRRGAAAVQTRQTAYARRLACRSYNASIALQKKLLASVRAGAHRLRPVGLSKAQAQPSGWPARPGGLRCRGGCGGGGTCSDGRLTDRYTVSRPPGGTSRPRLYAAVAVRHCAYKNHVHVDRSSEYGT